MLATRGCLPFRRVEGNTQSPAWEYVVFCFQRRMKSASNGWSGTGPFDALLFGKPTWPHVQVRRTWIIPSAKLTSCHCKPKHCGHVVILPSLCSRGRNQIHARKRSSDVRARYSEVIEVNGQEWFLHAQAEVAAPQ